ncbi:MAG: DNA repair protein RecN [Spirochaetae bacterium HGW-Spirochaetae-3]|jgi:DNA repair protein RecN (Recombination protein N)|nr:MAG: DNA repair protein RecN [Spirochaetae bacterium HGW-Spirochaetae-3]
MLEELSIRDFAIIDRLSVRFELGLNLLTGETGAGKSILIGAMGFILGAKADTGIIRSGAEETLVTGVVSVTGNADAVAWLAEHGMEAEDGAVIIRRGLKRTGRGSTYIQNVPVVRQDLQDFASKLVEVHGQRDGHALLKKDRHRELVDRYAGIGADVDVYASAYAELCAKRKALETMAGSDAERAREIELLRFAVEEIDAAAPRADEEAELADEERRLSQHEKLYASLSQARELLSEADGAIARIRKARTYLETAGTIDSRLSDHARRLDDAYYELEDLGESLTSYADLLLFDPARLEIIETRLATLQRLKRKYGVDLSAVIGYRAESAERLASLENWEEDRTGLEKQVASIEADVLAKAERLTKLRTEAARRLEVAALAIIATLGMPNARFAVRIGRFPPSGGKVVVGPTGADDLEFYVSANKGEPLRPLADVASGGELSRFMLALKTALAEDGGAPTMVFDEIDTGIGGEVALGVGLHLAKLALTKQVLCITHLASIAARADNHLMVEKHVEGDRTVTGVSRLGGDRRVREIARMLSGDPSSKTSLDHAADLVAKLGSSRGT